MQYLVFIVILVLCTISLGTTAFLKIPELSVRCKSAWIVMSTRNRNLVQSHFDCTGYLATAERSKQMFHTPCGDIIVSWMSKQMKMLANGYISVALVNVDFFLNSDSQSFIHGYFIDKDCENETIKVHDDINFYNV